jgi:phosphoribosylaminoimidazole-succinocarboxamide synthase
MKQALTETNFEFPNQTNAYKGKVRDVYTLNDHRLVMIASDRISAFDHILPKGIPHKGQVLNQVAAHFLDATADIVPNWKMSTPDPNVTVGKACEPIKLEMVVRGYLAGHAWRTYNSGERVLCGFRMHEGLKENDRFPEPIITPATKADEGHDEDISEAEVLKQSIVSEEVWNQLKSYTLQLFARGTEMAKERGLILVDTKYEFGVDVNGEITLIDEIHTPDSSRYFYAEGYEERQEKGEKQKQLSKEFVREWLMEHGFQGLEGQTMPEMPVEFVESVSARYIELYETITGKTFEPAETNDIERRIIANVSSCLNL